MVGYEIASWLGGGACRSRCDRCSGPGCDGAAALDLRDELPGGAGRGADAGRDAQPGTRPRRLPRRRATRVPPTALSGPAALDDEPRARRRLSHDDPIEQDAVARQAAAFHRWSTLATAAIIRKQALRAAATPPSEQQRSRVIDRFLVANDAYQARLLANREREERSAALLPVWLLLVLGTLFAAIGASVGWHARARRLHLEELASEQARFAEAIQFAENETGGTRAPHGAPGDGRFPGSSVVVLNRNNSPDRLEPSRPLDPDEPALHEPLESSQAAARVSPFGSAGATTAAGQRDAETISCQICGGSAGPSSCQPLLVGGEVIGSVLVEHARRLVRRATSRLRRLRQPRPRPCSPTCATSRSPRSAPPPTR